MLPLISYLTRVLRSAVGYAALLVGLCVCISSQALAAIEANNVLVLYNADDGPTGDGFQIASYYEQARPGVRLLGLTGINSILSGTLNENVSAADYLSVIRPQVLSEIGTISDSIDVIVTTKGLPLRIDTAGQPPGSQVPSSDWHRFSSLESELTRIDEISTLDQMGDQALFSFFPSFSPTKVVNPYYNTNVPFVRTGSDPSFEDIRLASRLDGYSVQSVKGVIDRAQNVSITRDSSYVVIDDDPTAGTDQMVDNSGPGPGLLNVVGAVGQANTYENTDNATVTAPGPVLGYVGHGANDGSGGLSSGYIQNELQFSLADGAVYLTHESFNGFSFDPSHVQTQGLVAEWLEIGGTAGFGNVSEPQNGSINVTNEDLFYQSMLPVAGALPGESGLTFIEAAWNATPQLSYVNTVIGDPLMRWTLALPGLQGDTNGDGTVEFNDFYTLQGNWLQAGTLEDGDFTGDGIIDQADFQILQDNWLMSEGLAASSTGEIVVLPVLNAETGTPVLSATIELAANFDRDLDVDFEDGALWAMSFGVDASGDSDADGDTDGADFLMWQQQTAAPYIMTADFNFDLKIDQSDLGIWTSSFGKNFGGDAEGDNDTDGADFLIFQSEYTAPIASPLSGAITVPEPATHVMATILALLLSSARRQGRRVD